MTCGEDISYGQIRRGTGPQLLSLLAVLSEDAKSRPKVHSSRIKVINRLADLRYLPAADALAAMLLDANELPEIIPPIAKALGKIGGKKAATALVDAWARVLDSEQSAVLEGLWQNREIVPPILLSKFKDCPSDENFSYSLALAKFGLVQAAIGLIQDAMREPGNEPKRMEFMLKLQYLKYEKSKAGSGAAVPSAGFDSLDLKRFPAANRRADSRANVQKIVAPASKVALI